MKKTEKDTQIAIYQGKNGAIEIRHDFDSETCWANKKQIAEIFGIDRSVVSRHIKNIFLDNELDAKVVCAKFAHTTNHGAIIGKTQSTKIEYYNLDIILAVGYRTKSNIAIKFRQWATKTLKQHITQGFTINQKRIQQNEILFFKTIEDLKLLSKDSLQIQTADVLELIKSFSSTWFSLDSYDKSEFPIEGTKSEIIFASDELITDIKKLKQELIQKKEATELFAQEKRNGSLEGIVGNIFQSVFGMDAYESLEEKAAHLLYFIIKNHPFNDGNKRSGAFAFIWFLKKSGINFNTKINPQTLTTLTILIAESNPQDKEKMIGIVLLLLKKEK